MNGQKLAVTDKFVYLGSTLSRSVNIDEEVSYRIARASAAFGRLRDTVWERRGLTKETKLKVYQAVVLPSLLYACETWTTYSHHVKQLNAFHMRSGACSISRGRTRSQTPKCFNAQKWKAYMPSCSDTTFDGPAMFTVWTIVVFQRDFSTVNCQQGNAQQADLKSATKTL